MSPRCVTIEREWNIMITFNRTEYFWSFIKIEQWYHFYLFAVSKIKPYELFLYFVTAKKSMLLFQHTRNSCVSGWLCDFLPWPIGKPCSSSCEIQHWHYTYQTGTERLGTPESHSFKVFFETQTLLTFLWRGPHPFHHWCLHCWGKASRE